jgi:hypothetical protein
MELNRGCKNCQHNDLPAGEYPCNRCYPVMSNFESVVGLNNESVEHEKESGDVEGD